MDGQGDRQQDLLEIDERLEVVEQRLKEHAEGAAPTGLTEPDEGGTERWEAAQVWGHIAEFVSYWQSQLEKIVDDYDGQPIPFGRTKDDVGRLEGIESGREEPIAVLMEEVEGGIEGVRRYLPTLTDKQWASVGLHPVRGEMDVPQIVKRFTVSHLEEHANQLDSLRS